MLKIQRLITFNTATPHESDSRILQLTTLGTHTPSLVFCYPCMQWVNMTVELWECSDLDVGACIF